jgi:hypothetical protein
VGQRVARLLARQGAEVRVGSRQLARATKVIDAIRGRVHGARLEAAAITGLDELQSALSGRTLVVAAGAAGVVLLPKAARAASPGLKVAIDLNAVPPLGVEGVEAGDKGVDRDGAVCYGALGVGGTKMKIHRAAVARLFESNDQVLDTDAVYAIAKELI